MDLGPLLTAAFGGGVVATVSGEFIRRKAAREEFERQRRALLLDDRRRIYARFLFLTRLATTHATFGIGVEKAKEATERARSLLHGALEAEVEIDLIGSDEVRAILPGLDEMMDSFSTDFLARAEWSLPDDATPDEIADRAAKLSALAQTLYHRHLAPRVAELAEVMRADIKKDIGDPPPHHRWRSRNSAPEGTTKPARG